MPAALANGSPIQLCHSVFPIEFLDDLSIQKNTNDIAKPHAHHARHNDSSDSLNTNPTPELRSQETCSFGALNLDNFLFPISAVITQSDFSHSFNDVLNTLFIRRTSSSYHARAPPSHS